MKPTADVTEGRQHYIGASEAHSVVDLPPYGCRRRLALEKIGVGYDVGEDGISPLLAERGTDLEPVAAKLLERDTGLWLTEAREFTSDLTDSHPWLVAHADRVARVQGAGEWAKLLGVAERGPGCPTEWPDDEGLAEIKTSNEYVYRQVCMEGPKPFHVAQLQHQLLCLRKSWGILWYVHPDSFRRRGWIFGADPVFAEKYLAAGDNLWAMIERARPYMTGASSPDLWDQWLPARLPADSSQCKKCPFRRSCQGQRLLDILKLPQTDGVADMSSDPRWSAAVREWHELTDIGKDLDARKAEVRETLESLMGDDRHAAEGGGGRVYWKPQAGRTSPDGKGMAAALLELADGMEDDALAADLRTIAATTKTTKPSRPFRVYRV